MPSRKTQFAFALMAAALTPPAAPAASPDAWAAFRKDVEASCRAAAAPLIEGARVTVDPFGSESYGLALLTGKAVDDGSDRSVVCVYDKVTHKSEIGGAMALQKAGEQVAAGASPLATAVPESSAIAAEATAPSAPASDAEPAVALQAAPLATAEPDIGGAVAAPAASAGADTPASSAAPTVDPAADPEAEAALADRFASFPDDPQEQEAGAANAADADPEPSPQNQRVVTPPMPILPSVPGPAAASGAPADEADTATPDEASAPAGIQTAAADALEGGQGSPAPFAGCAADCTATLASLSEVDRKSLADLPFEIDRTIARNADADLGAGPGAARAAVGEVAANLTGRPSPSIAAPTAALEGERSCVLYYFGYSNQAARSVGRHRCSVSAGEGGVVVVEKISGEHLRAELKPLTSGVSAFVGRTFKAGQADTRYDPAKPVSESDKELGNSVGLATVSDGRVMLTSSELRRFAGEDNFFWVLAIDPK